jgi:hypothetical protein
MAGSRRGADNVVRDVKRAKISCNSSGANEIVAAVAGKRIVVLSYVLVVAGAVSAKWQSASTDLSGAMALAANGGVSAPEASAGHVETATAEALNLHLSSGVAAAGHVTYEEHQ